MRRSCAQRWSLYPITQFVDGSHIVKGGSFTTDSHDWTELNILAYTAVNEYFVHVHAICKQQEEAIVN